jgi:hypothetical protein
VTVDGAAVLAGERRSRQARVTTGFTFSSKLRGRNAEHIVLDLSRRALLFRENKTG